MVLWERGNFCGDLYYNAQGAFDRARFKKEPGQLAVRQKATALPPVAIFGKYKGVFECSPDDSPKDPKVERCADLVARDNVNIAPSKNADAHVVIKTHGVNGHSCWLKEGMAWFGDHLVFAKERINEPGNPYLVQLWFKGDKLEVLDVGDTHETYCGARSRLGGDFKKAPASPRRSTKR